MIVIDKKSNIIMGSSTCVNWKRYGTKTSLMDVIWHGLMYCTKLLLNGSISMLPDLFVLGINLKLMLMRRKIFVVILFIYCVERRY